MSFIHALNMVWGDGFMEWFRGAEPEHLRRGRLGERVAKRHLKKAGLKFLYANYRTNKGEIDLIFRDGKALVFVEVKTRSSESWTRPAAAVNAGKKRKLTAAARNYLRLLHNPELLTASTSWKCCSMTARWLKYVINPMPLLQDAGDCSCKF